MGDRGVAVGYARPTGTLVLDNLLPWDSGCFILFGTGTGLAPFLSIIKDPETDERFAQVILVHGCRKTAELAYGDGIIASLPKGRADRRGRGEAARLLVRPSRREPFRNRGRVTDLVSERAALGPSSACRASRPITDRVMLCGSPEMLRDMRATARGAGLCAKEADAEARRLRAREGLSSSAGRRGFSRHATQLGRLSKLQHDVDETDATICRIGAGSRRGAAIRSATKDTHGRRSSTPLPGVGIPPSTKLGEHRQEGCSGWRRWCRGRRRSASSSPLTNPETRSGSRA